MLYPSLSALRAFDAAARLGGFKQAAQELGVTPTAISHQIRTLEQQLGLALFNRQTRKVHLTDAGQRLATATAGAFQQISEALEDLVEDERTLTVSTTPAFAGLWLVPKLRDFETAHPEIRVHVDTSTNLVDFQRDRQVDLAIRYGNGPYAGASSEILVQERFAAFAAPDYLASLPDAEPTVLIETQWRLGSAPPITWADWFAANGQPLPSASTTRSFDEEQHVISAGLAGQGLILISTLLVSDLVNRGWLTPYKPDITVPGLTYTCLTKQDGPIPRKVRHFLSWLKDQSLN